LLDNDLSFFASPCRPSFQFRFDDGDESFDIQDYFVMHWSDYLISTSKVSDDGDGIRSEWIGVRNRVDKASTDEWAILVG
jgi:hypothetical protein